MTKNDDKYTDPELRSQIKEEIQAGDKGGHPGQWSARKAQLMASEYKKQMHERGEEPYTTDKSEQSESQQHLNDWTKEDWQTSEGKGDAKQADGTEQRYLPKKAWENMTEEEKEETNKAKLEGSARGEQFVPNTDVAKEARKHAQEKESADVVEQNGAEASGHDVTERAHEKPEGTSPKRGTKHRRDSESKAEEHAKHADKAGDEEYVDETTKSQPPAKQAKGNDGETRTTQPHSKGESREPDQKAAEDEKKDDEEHGQPGSATRLPKEGQHVFWRATPGWVEGTVVEIAYSEKEVDGKHVKASEDDPRIVLKSGKSGKIAVHKHEAVYF